MPPSGHPVGTADSAGGGDGGLHARPFGGDSMGMYGGMFSLHLNDAAPPPCLHVMSAVFPDRLPGASVFIGDSGAVIHRFSSGEVVYNRW